MKKVVPGLKELEEAEARCGDSNSFVNSVRDFYTAAGFISSKQIAALENAEPPCKRPRSYFEDLDDELDGDFEIMQDMDYSDQF